MKYKCSCGNIAEILVREFRKGVRCISCVSQRYQITNVQKYDVAFISQVPDVKEKVKQTNLAKYGVECPFASEPVKEKIRMTMLERYGVENPQQLNEIKEKTKKNQS